MQPNPIPNPISPLLGPPNLPMNLDPHLPTQRPHTSFQPNNLLEKGSKHSDLDPTRLASMENNGNRENDTFFQSNRPIPIIRNILYHND